jgi:uncharacterized protein (TIGR00369 family)
MATGVEGEGVSSTNEHRSAAEARRALGITVAEVNAFADEQLPFTAELGLRCESLDVDEAVVRWHFDRRWTRPVDFVCGPVTMALADFAVYCASFTRGGIVELNLTNELKTTFLRPAAGGVDLLCRARILKRGRKVVYGVADVFEDGSPDRLVAQATTTYVVAG